MAHLVHVTRAVTITCPRDPRIDRRAYRGPIASSQLWAEDWDAKLTVLPNEIIHKIPISRRLVRWPWCNFNKR